MKRTFKIIAIVIVVLLVLAAGAAGYFWYMMGQPLYEPGMVSAGKNLRAPLTPPAQSNDAHFWTVEPDIQLYHFSQGQGKNVLIVHGGPGMPYTKPWTGLQPLTQNYTFNYYDQRGCGQSTRPFDKFTSSNYYDNLTALDKTLGIGAQVADIERIRQILGEDKLILIGHSWGGFLASLYAAEFPQHVQALILIAPADALLMPQEEGGLFEEVRQRLPASQQADYAAFINKYLDFQSIFSKSEADLIAQGEEFGKYYLAAVKTTLPQEGKPGGWMVYAQYFSMGTRHDYRGALKNVQAPVLVIHGADDLQSEKTTRIYANAFPNTQFSVMPQVTHFPFEEQPAQFAALVGDFLAGLK